MRKNAIDVKKIIRTMLTITILWGTASMIYPYANANYNIAGLSDYEEVNQTSAPLEMIENVKAEILPLSIATADQTVAAGETVTISANVTGDIIVEGELILDANFTITGMVTVRNGGTFTMSAGTITGNTSRGVTVTGEGSSFVMTGGTITGNRSIGDTQGVGGGVAVLSAASFEMSGTASITNNVAEGNGGGVVLTGADSTFTMRGGVISHNHTYGVEGGGGIRAHAESGTGNAYVNVYGGNIHNNTAVNSGGGVSMSNSVLTMRGGDVFENRTYSTGNGGGGVRITARSTFNMVDGNIFNNESRNNGGGVSVAGTGSNFTMSGGVIEDNEAVIGGGVWVGSSGVFTMNDADALIYDNEATARGGGVYVTTTNSSFTMSSGTIENNVAPNGGGVNVNDSTFNLNEGLITANRASNGGGVRVVSGGSMTMTGGEISHHTQRNIQQENPDHVRPWGITDGGGILLVNGTLDLEGGIISHNIASNGSGIRANVPSIITMTGGIIEFNGYRGRVGHPELPHINITGSGIFIGSGSVAPDPNPATLVMEGGYIQNNIGTNGAGVLVGANVNAGIPIHAVMELHGGYIRDNHNFYHTGGGIDVRPTGSLTMYGGEVSGNSATYGGGILLNGTTFFFHGGDIINNTAHIHPYGRIMGDGEYAGGAGGSGGGIQVGWWQSGSTQPSRVEITSANATISNNTAEVVGGGLYLAGFYSELEATAGQITDNHAEEDGGGIFTDNYHYNRVLSDEAYANLSIAPEAVFADNTAGNGSFEPPSNWEDTDIRGDGTSPAIAAHQVHQLNNYDVNFRLISITKDADIASAAVGDIIEYTITVNNPSREALEGEFVIVDIIDTDLVDFVPESVQVNGEDAEYSFEDSELRVVLSPLEAGDTVVTFDVVVRKEAAGLAVSNIATLEIPGEDDITTGEIIVVIDPDILSPAIVKDADASSAEVGDVIEYTITVDNPNDFDLEGEFVVVDIIDISLVDFVIGSVEVDGDEVDYSFDSETGELRVVLDPLAAGATVVTFAVIAREDAAGLTVVNVAVLEVPEDSDFDFDEDDLITDEVLVEIYPEDPTVLRSPTISKAANVNRAAVGATIAYQITVNNPNEVDLDGEFVVVDVIDISLVEFVRGSVRVNDEVSDYSFNSTTGELRVVLDPLAVGDTNVTFNVVVRNDAAGQTVINVAVLEIPEDGEFDFPAPLPTPEVPVEIDPLDPGQRPATPSRPSGNLPQTGAIVGSALLVGIGLTALGFGITSQKRKSN